NSYNKGNDELIVKEFITQLFKTRGLISSSFNLTHKLLLANLRPYLPPNQQILMEDETTYLSTFLKNL
ncbi:470_t:CDS:2, partial [Gigaspora rosea]